jgi:hypothetical protein
MTPAREVDIDWLPHRRRAVAGGSAKEGSS